VQFFRPPTALAYCPKSTCAVEPPQLPCGNWGFSDPHKTKITPVHHPTSSTSRATLSSKVTEPFCRLPLHTFCPKLEAINLEHLLRFVERLDWKLTLSLQFSWRTKKAGRRKNGFLLFKRNEKDQRIILINNSFKGPLSAPTLLPPRPNPSFHFFKQKRHLCCRFFLLAWSSFALPQTNPKRRASCPARRI
jgi:hypothetical protein